MITNLGESPSKQRTFEAFGERACKIDDPRGFPRWMHDYPLCC